MNLRDKLRAVGASGSTGKPRETSREESRDCRHLAVTRPLSEFPGAQAVRRDTLEKMTGLALPEPFDPEE